MTRHQTHKLVGASNKLSRLHAVHYGRKQLQQPVERDLSGLLGAGLAKWQDQAQSIEPDPIASGPGVPPSRRHRVKIL